MAYGSQLRPYQEQAHAAVWNHLHMRACLASLPTGSGKSHVIASLCHRALKEYPTTNILVIAHVKELLAQNAEKIQEHWPLAPIGLYCAGLRQRKVAPITVASIQSIHKKDIGRFDLIFVDECHRIPHGADGQYHALFDSQPDARIAGFTATPYRLGGGRLDKGEDALFEKLVVEIKTRDLVEAGYLCPIRAKRGSAEADLENVHMRGGEYITSEMAQAFDTSDVTKAAVADVLKHAQRRHSIMYFCCSVAHCHHVADALRAAGEKSVAVVTGETPPQDRTAAIEGVRRQTLRHLVNCDVLTTGFDAPCIDCIAFLRATQSPALYVQIVGRGLRKHASKEDCLLLDYGGNVERHGPIDDITAERVQKGTGVAPTRACPECGEILPVQAKTCKACGYIFPLIDDEVGKAPHGTEASDKDPLGFRSARWRVASVGYRLHEKVGKPPSMRVTYHVVPEDAPEANQFTAAAYRPVEEWVCFEHEGMARSKAVAWALRRGVHPAPDTVDEALVTTFIEPKYITVKPAGKFHEIIAYEF